MPVQKNPSTNQAEAKWSAKHSAGFRYEQEKEDVEKFFKRREVADRIKQAKIKIKMTVKAKLQDDLRVFEYEVIEVDKKEGVVTLKNEHNTVRKVSVFDKLFGPVARRKKSGMNERYKIEV